jgi:hypothetical protein
MHTDAQLFTKNCAEALANQGVDAKSFYSIAYGTVLFLALLEAMGATAVIFGGDLCGSVMLMVFLLLVRNHSQPSRW